MRRARVVWTGLCAPAALALAAPAGAVPQFTPTGTERLHTVSSGQPGTTWNTGANGATGGQITYSDVTQVLTVSGGIDVLNYYDPANGSCSTDVGSNCSVNFAPDLTLTVEAALDSIDVTPVGGSFYDITINFGSNNPGALDWDVTWTDPNDGGSTQFSADWVAGLFQGTPTTGLSASLIYDSNSQTVSGNVNVVGFLEVDPSSPLSSLFDSAGNFFGVDLSAQSNFSPTLNSIAQSAFDTGVLPSFTADGAGQVYRLAEGQFVIPEPATGLLFAAGLLGLSIRARSRS